MWLLFLHTHGCCCQVFPMQTSLYFNWFSEILYWVSTAGRWRHLSLLSLSHLSSESAKCQHWCVLSVLWDAIYAYQLVVSGLQTFHGFHSIVFCVTFVYIGGVWAEFISGSPTVWLNKHLYILWLSQTRFFGLQTFITGGVSILQIHDLFLTLEFKVTIQRYFWFTCFVLFFSTKSSAIIMYLDL